jgi:regulation of enolase protein 1 (concanavalin A-like superfamily)
MKIDFSCGRWINKPKHSQIDADSVEIMTEPETDFWQRSYYGFRNDNAPALLLESDKNFTFITRASFIYENQFDQCGLIILNNFVNKRDITDKKS